MSEKNRIIATEEEKIRYRKYHAERINTNIIFKHSTEHNADDIAAILWAVEYLKSLGITLVSEKITNFSCELLSSSENSWIFAENFVNSKFQQHP